MQPIILTGTPQLVDSFIRPIIRAVQVAIGLMGSAILFFMGWMWWVPVPLALSFVAYELYFWRRGDRAQAVLLQDGALRLVDPLAEAPLVLPLAEITVATLYYRQLELDEVELAIVFGDDEDVRFALRVLTTAPFSPLPHDIPADVYDLVFGGVAGLFRALAPPARRPRQTFHDSDGRLLAALRAQLPDEVWRRTAIRLWPGMEPEIDLFGYFEGPHGDWLVLDGRQWKRSDDSGSIEGWSFGGAERSAVLFSGLDKQRVEQLPLALIHLSGRTTVAIPAPLSVGLAQPQPLSSDLLHTHAPEGAALLWHLLVHTPRDRWPPRFRQMIAERESIYADLDTALPG